MDEFEDSLEKIIASQQEAAREAHDKAVLLEGRRISEERAKTELCENFYQKHLKPILDIVNERVASNKGAISTFPKSFRYSNSGQSSFSSNLVWRKEDDPFQLQHVLGFNVDPGRGNSFATTVVAGRTPENIALNARSFVVKNNNLAQVKKYILELMTNPEMTREIRSTVSGEHELDPT